MKEMDMSQIESKSLIPAVGYLRKSTKGERAGGRQKQEKSISQQKTEILKIARGRFDILKWFEDEGVSGWKRGAKRPDFQKMIDDANDLGAQAILCDHLDRFSRATYDDVQEDASALRRAGVRWIVTASHSEYDLNAGRRNDIGAIITFAAAVWGAHEVSRNLGRRIALARRNAAQLGKRTGGYAPYGMEDDGHGGLKPGDPKKVKVVQWLFDQYANHGRSLNGLATDLNVAQKVPGPSGGPWYVKIIGTLLRKCVYRGDFSYGETRSGQFYSHDAKGEVVSVEELHGSKCEPFVIKGVYQPLVDPALFDKVQRKLASIKVDRSRRKRAGYSLTGVLICDHCGAPLYGSPQHGGKSVTIYRCSANQARGQGACAGQTRFNLPNYCRLLDPDKCTRLSFSSESPVLDHGGEAWPLPPSASNATCV